MSEQNGAGVTPGVGQGASNQGVVSTATGGGVGGGGAGKPSEEQKPPTLETISMPKDAFDERLSKAGEAAQRKFLKSLGFDKPEDLQSVLQVAKTLQDEKKTEKERLEGRIKELEPRATRADALAKQFESVVSAEFDKLPENIRTAIDKLADGDAEKRWSQMQVLRDAGLLNGSSATQSAPPPPAPKNVGPNGGPPPKPTDGTKTKFDEWDALRKQNPTRASIFYQLHGHAIEASRPADQ